MLFVSLIVHPGCKKTEILSPLTDLMNTYKGNIYQIEIVGHIK